MTRERDTIMLDNHVLMVVSDRWEELQREADHRRLAQEASLSKVRVHNVLKSKLVAFAHMLLLARS